MDEGNDFIEPWCDVQALHGVIRKECPLGRLDKLGGWKDSIPLQIVPVLPVTDRFTCSLEILDFP